MKRVLFLCSRNKRRSATAEAVFTGHPGVEVDSAGLAPDAVVPLSADQIAWADLILVMEEAHRAKLNRRFRTETAGKRVAVLGIPDDFDFMDPALIRLLQRRCASFLP